MDFKIKMFLVNYFYILFLMKFLWIINFDKDKNGRLIYIKKRMNYCKFNVFLLVEIWWILGNKRVFDSREV